MKKLLPIIKRIESSAYPAEMQELQDCTSWGEVQEYCETEDVHCFTDRTSWYALIGVSGDVAEFVDFAKTDAAPATAMFSMLRQLLKLLEQKKIKTLTMDCRGETSFPLLKVAKRYGWEAASSHSYRRDGETFWEVTLSR